MEFVNYEIAKKLKEKGFREKCFATYTHYGGTLKFNEINVYKRPKSYELNIKEFIECYNVYEKNNIDAPTISQVLKWLREDKKLFVEVIAAAYGYIYIISDTPDNGGTDREYSLHRGSNDACAWDDYNDCVLDAINNILDNLI